MSTRRTPTALQPSASATAHPTVADAVTSPDAALRDLGYEPALGRRLGFGALLVYGLLFFVPLAPVAVFGMVVNRSRGVPVAVYLLAAFVMGLSALSYREMALRWPVAGSVYSYVRLSTNEHLGAAAGLLILIDYVLMPTLLSILSGIALQQLFPSTPMRVFIALFVLVSLLVNLRGIEITTRVGVVLLVAQLATIGLFAVFVVRAMVRGSVRFTLMGVWHRGVSVGALAGASSIAALSYLGFDAIATLNEEARGGGRAVAWATGALLAGVTTLFCLQVWLCSCLVPVRVFAPGDATDQAFYRAVDAVSPHWFQTVFTVANAFVAIFACLVVAHASSARLVFAMARDAVLPRSLARTSRSGRPVVATVAVAAITLLLAIAFAGRAEVMTSVVTFGAMGSYVLLHVAVVRQCWVREHSGRVMVHLVVPVLGAVCLLGILSTSSPRAQWVAGTWLLIGMVLHGTRVALDRRRSPAGVAGGH